MHAMENKAAFFYIGDKVPCYPGIKLSKFRKFMPIIEYAPLKCSCENIDSLKPGCFNSATLNAELSPWSKIFR